MMRLTVSRGNAARRRTRDIAHCDGGPQARLVAPARRHLIDPEPMDHLSLGRQSWLGTLEAVAPFRLHAQIDLLYALAAGRMAIRSGGQIEPSRSCCLGSVVPLRAGWPGWREDSKLVPWATGEPARSLRLWFAHQSGWSVSVRLSQRSW